MNRKFSIRKTDCRGFTLIELMVVIVILGILAGLIIPRIMGRPEEAKRLKANMQIASLETALKLYKLDNGMYPDTEQGLQALVEQRKQGASYGETGVARVQCLSGDAVWEAGEQGVYDKELLQASLDRLPRQLWGKRTVREAVKSPSLFHIEYRDGLLHFISLEMADEMPFHFVTDSGKCLLGFLHIVFLDDLYPRLIGTHNFLRCACFGRGHELHSRWQFRKYPADILFDHDNILCQNCRSRLRRRAKKLHLGGSTPKFHLFKDYFMSGQIAR